MEYWTRLGIKAAFIIDAWYFGDQLTLPREQKSLPKMPTKSGYSEIMGWLLPRATQRAGTR